jgi:predicted  nucleic acid-binding Zn-ribbon protein
MEIRDKFFPDNLGIYNYKNLVIMIKNIQVFFMKTISNRSISRAKISTMPRTKSDASSQLDLYKMVTEKQRIQRDMYSIKERMGLLQQRLDILNQQIEATEKTIHKLRQPHSNTAQNIVRSNIFVESNNYQTFEVEY